MSLQKLSFSIGSECCLSLEVRGTCQLLRNLFWHGHMLAWGWRSHGQSQAQRLVLLSVEHVQVSILGTSSRCSVCQATCKATERLSLKQHLRSHTTVGCFTWRSIPQLVVQVDTASLILSWHLSPEAINQRCEVLIWKCRHPLGPCCELSSSTYHSMQIDLDLVAGDVTNTPLR